MPQYKTYFEHIVTNNNKWLHIHFIITQNAVVLKGACFSSTNRFHFEVSFFFFLSKKLQRLDLTGRNKDLKNHLASCAKSALCDNYWSRPFALDSPPWFNTSALMVRWHCWTTLCTYVLPIKLILIIMPGAWAPWAEAMFTALLPHLWVCHDIQYCIMQSGFRACKAISNKLVS